MMTEASRPMIAITTKSSMRVKPRLLLIPLKTRQLWKKTNGVKLLPTDDIRAFARIGVHELIFDFRGGSTADSVERLQRFAGQVMPLVD